MAWTTLSTVNELKRDLPMVVDANTSLTTIEDAISDAQDIVYDDLSRYVDWDDIEDLASVPRVINRLARYQTVMLIIIRNFQNNDQIIGGDGVPPETTIYRHYENLYNNLLNQIKTGDILILGSDNDALDEDEFRTTGPGRII